MKNLKKSKTKTSKAKTSAGRVEKNVSGHPDLRWFPLIKIYIYRGMGKYPLLHSLA